MHFRLNLSLEISVSAHKAAGYLPPLHMSQQHFIIVLDGRPAMPFDHTFPTFTCSVPSLMTPDVEKNVSITGALRQEASRSL